MADKKPTGLEDVVVADSSICYIDGKRGQLVYRGYDIDDLAAHSTFEEVAYLLWNGELPTADELAALRRDLGEAMALPPEVIDILRLLPEATHPMRALSVATAALGTFDLQTDDNSEAANRAKAV